MHRYDGVVTELEDCRLFAHRTCMHLKTAGTVKLERRFWSLVTDNWDQRAPDLC